MYICVFIYVYMYMWRGGTLGPRGYGFVPSSFLPSLPAATATSATAATAVPVAVCKRSTAVPSAAAITAAAGSG